MTLDWTDYHCPTAPDFSLMALTRGHRSAIRTDTGDLP